MAINIDQFKYNFQDGGARPNLFRVNFAGNVMVGQAAQEMLFTVRAASLPASTLGVIEVPYQGRKIPVAGDRTYGEWTVTVLNKETFNVRAALEDWSYKINHFEANVRDLAAYDLSQYKTDAMVEHLDKSGLVIASYKFVGMFPTEVSAIELAWDTTDSIEEFTTNFRYDYFVPVTRGEISL
jgi:hypothetical protein